MRKLLSVHLVTGVLVLSAGCAARHSQDEFGQFLQAHVAKVEPLSARANLVYWEAATTGKPEKFEELKQLQLQIRRIYSDANDFARIKKFDESKSVREPRLARQLDKLYCAYLQNQIEPALLRADRGAGYERSAGLQQLSRPPLDGRTVTMSDIYTILTTEKDVGQTRGGLAGQQAGRQRHHRGLPRTGPPPQPGRPASSASTTTTRWPSSPASRTSRTWIVIFEELDWLTRGPFARLEGGAR